MRLYSTKNPNTFVDLKEAVLKGLPNDNGLFMPEVIPPLPASFWQNLKEYSFQEIAFEVCKNLMQGSIPDYDLHEIIEKSMTFPAPLVRLDRQLYILELFHGPSLAFKDFGARFMAQLMSYFNRDESRELVILVATSGDTGGAVAAGFYQTPGIKVVILYPSGKVSMLQEKQLTTLEHNVTAIEVNGTFDDCQALVKQAFLDKELADKIHLSSANSINIARLIPQTFYYIEAYRQLDYRAKKPIVFCVPSGNFGNLTAGLFAQKMGMPASHFVAATNVNDIVPKYLQTGKYIPRASSRTLSNAMDVGNPSNFARMLDIFGEKWEDMKQNITGFSINDKETRAAMKEVLVRYRYVIDPHGAVAYLALQKYQETHPDIRGIILETAHPAKFLDDVETILERKVAIPPQLAALAHKEKHSVRMGKSFQSFKEWLMKNY